MRSQYSHHLNHRNTFLPILCSKPSIKEVSLPRSSSFSNDPLSPRVGCMGQVKRSNKIAAGFPTSTTSSSSSSSSHRLSAAATTNIKYFKLKSLFSGKSLTTPTTTTAARTTTTSRSRRRQEMIVDCSINLVELDPPLPVNKRVQKRNEGEGDGKNLWKRRSAGVELKSLQIQPIQLPNRSLRPTSV